MPSGPRRSRWTPLLGLALAVVASACAGGTGGGGTPSPAPLDPTGRWQETTTVQGQGIPVTIVISGTPGAYAGSLEPAPDIPPIALNRIEVAGTTLTMSGAVMGQALTLVLVVDGNDMAGTWSSGGNSGPITASRTPG
jgi:hypothetical protein